MFSHKKIGENIVAINMNAKNEDDKYIYIKNDDPSNNFIFNDDNTLCTACRNSFDNKTKLNDHLKSCKLYLTAKKAADKRISELKEQAENYSKSDNWSIKSFTGYNLFPTDFSTYNYPKERIVLFIIGASGSGKSTFASNFLKVNSDKEQKKYLISSRSADIDGGVYSNMNMKQIKLNKNFNITPTSEITKKLNDSFIIFDDVENIVNSQVPQLISDILIIGRKEKISMIEISHIPHNKTKSFTESHGIVLFPDGLSANLLERILVNYLGFNKKQIDKLKSLDNRWIYIHKAYPMYIMGHDFIATLKNF